MSVLHVHPVPGSKQAQIKFNQYKYCTKAPFVIYADFESILEPSGRQIKHITYTQQHKVCAAAAILPSRLYNFEQRTVMKVKENALTEFLDTLILWEAEIVAILRTNRAMNFLSARQQEEYDNATGCYICRNEFVENEAKGLEVRDHDHITGWFISAAHSQSNLERRVSFKITMFFHNFFGYDALLIVDEFGKRFDREIKVIDQNMEKYLQVEMKQNMVFRDSLQFLPAFLLQLEASLANVAADISKIFTTWSWMCTLRRTLSFSSDRESSAITTSTRSRVSINRHYHYERPFSTSSETWSAHRRATRTPSKCGKTSTARV